MLIVFQHMQTGLQFIWWRINAILRQEEIQIFREYTALLSFQSILLFKKANKTLFFLQQLLSFQNWSDKCQVFLVLKWKKKLEQIFKQSKSKNGQGWLCLCCVLGHLLTWSELFWGQKMAHPHTGTDISNDHTFRVAQIRRNRPAKV